MLRRLPSVGDANVIADYAGFDDGAVYRLADDLAIVVSVDLFAPVVDDPGSFGRIAAANAISDIYAMGGRPLFALAIVGWPRALDLEICARVVEGGAAKAAEAGCAIIGGHSIDDPEPKYGLAVTGTVHPDAIWHNSGGRDGDELFLTKALGVGIIVAAAKAGEVDADVLAAAVASMEWLNRDAAAAAAVAGPTAVTDVTGFGLVGHLHEMAAASGLSARIEAASLPVLAGARRLAAAGHAPGGSLRNLDAASGYARFGHTVSEVDRLLACDAQTSGGLLVALPRAFADTFVAACRERAVEAVRIGSLTAGTAGAVLVD